MKFFKWFWAFVPASAKIWVIVAGVAIILSVLGFSVYKIQKWGYDRCEIKYAVASAELKDQSRKEILKAEKKYDQIKTEIAKVKGSDDPVGPRVELAIDRMPGAPDSE